MENSFFLAEIRSVFCVHDATRVSRQLRARASIRDERWDVRPKRSPNSGSRDVRQEPTGKNVRRDAYLHERGYEMLERRRWNAGRVLQGYSGVSRS